MSVALTQFIGPIQADAPGCPQPVILFNLRRAIQQLCRHAYVWQRDLATFALVDGDYTYTPTLPAGETDAQIIALVQRAKVTRLADSTTYFVSPTPRAQLAPEGWETETGDTLRALFVQHQNTVRVVPIPNASAVGDTVGIRVALEPTDAAASVASELYEDALYRDCIEHGTVSRLLAMPGKEWSAPADAVLRGRLFRSHLAAAYMRAYQDATGADLQVQMVPFGV